MKKDIAESRSVCYSYVKVIGNVTDNDTDIVTETVSVKPAE